MDEFAITILRSASITCTVAHALTHALRFNGHFTGEPGLASVN